MLHSGHSCHSYQLINVSVLGTSMLSSWPPMCCIAGNVWGRKLSQISQLCGYLWKFSPRNLGGWHTLVRQKVAICISFLCESHIFYQFTKVFSLESFLPYGIGIGNLHSYWLTFNVLVVGTSMHRSCPPMYRYWGPPCLLVVLQWQYSGYQTLRKESIKLCTHTCEMCTVAFTGV